MDSHQRRKLRRAQKRAAQESGATTATTPEHKATVSSGEQSMHATNGGIGWKVFWLGGGIVGALLPEFIKFRPNVETLILFIAGIWLWLLLFSFKRVRALGWVLRIVFGMTWAVVVVALFVYGLPLLTLTGNEPISDKQLCSDTTTLINEIRQFKERTEAEVRRLENLYQDLMSITAADGRAALGTRRNAEIAAMLYRQTCYRSRPAV